MSDTEGEREREREIMWVICHFTFIYNEHTDFKLRERGSLKCKTGDQNFAY